jgi:signal transduction histidine kinase
MKIKSKLIFSYAVMLAIVLGISGAALWSIMGWSRAAGKLSDTYGQGLLAERLRANMTRQINYAERFLDGDRMSKAGFLETQAVTAALLNELKAGESSEDEADHIRGLNETQYELAWVMQRLFEREDGLSDPDARDTAGGRLGEISDEVADDIAALNQFYRGQENRRIAGAKQAGTVAMAVIALAVVIAAAQVVALIVLLQRWLVYPIESVGQTTREISSGNFDSRVPIDTPDEWGEMAAAINNMSKNLKLSQEKLVLQERLAALGEIGSYTAHNLRNPLAGIRAAAQVALSEPAGSQPEVAEALNGIISAVDRMDNWIMRFLSYARPLIPEIDTHDINRIAALAGSSAHRPFADRAELELRLADNLPEAQVDSVLIEQVIQVIAANAFESLDGSGRVEIATNLESFPEGDPWVVIHIIDNGRGIPARVKEKLFKPFTTSKEGGTGLGLAQAKKIVSLHGGEIAVDSGETGTRVTIRLPLKNYSASAVDE